MIHQSPSLHSGGAHPQLLKQLAHILHLALQHRKAPISLHFPGEYSCRPKTAKTVVGIKVLLRPGNHLLVATSVGHDTTCVKQSENTDVEVTSEVQPLLESGKAQELLAAQGLQPLAGSTWPLVECFEVAEYEDWLEKVRIANG